MKKGFTLVELLAVIVILGMTIAIVAVKIDNNIKEANKFGYEQTINLIENAAYLYAEEYTSELTNFNEKKVAVVDISKLIQKGFIKQSDIKNVESSDKVVIAEVNNVIKTKYTKQEKNAIFLIGEKEVSINEGDTYEELGAYVAVINTGLIELTSSNITSNINSNLKGKYEVTYSYTNADSIKRIIKVI